MQLMVNGKAVEFDADPEMPLLWALRDIAGLKGTKFGCGVAACGAGTVVIDGVPTRSCQTALGDVAGQITTIEGITNGEKLHAVQQAWLEEQVPQCGYCQSGMIMAVTALLKANPAPSDDEIDTAITNICRCGTYPRIQRAIHTVARGTEAAS